MHYLKSALTLFCAVSIRDAFTQVLKEDLGKYWYQLATGMGLARTPIDAIQEKADAELVWKIDTFLERYKFPSFESDRETAEFLIAVLQKASLSTIAATVKRHLEQILDIEGAQFFCMHSCVVLSGHM